MTYVDVARLTSPAASALGPEAVGVVPIGALEQHGPHLPLDTDSVITWELARRVADRVAEPVAVAPLLPLGLSQHHLAFPGTFTIDEPVLAGLLDAYVDGFRRMGVRRVALVSGHGGNFRALAAYADAPRDGVDVATYADFARVLELIAAAGVDAPAVDSHAGAHETGMVMAILGEGAVEAVGAEVGYRGGDPDWLARLQGDGVHTLTSDGVLGDPSLATASGGAASIDALVEELTAWLVSRFGLRYA